jgi:hypothetical protein
MGSYYQPASYFKGGKRRTRCTRKLKGGFTPSIMGNVVSAGGYMIPLALRQGYMLLNSSSKTKSKRRKSKTLRKKHK